MTICAVVYDSDISVNYLDPGVEDANLQGATRGIVAFTVLQIIPFGENGALRDAPFLEQANDPQEIAKVLVRIEDAKNDSGTGVCQTELILYKPTGQTIINSHDSRVDGQVTDLDTGFGKIPIPPIFPIP